MKARQAYLDLQERQRQELNDFPIAYAFSSEQLKEALEKLGAKSVSECVTIMNHGDIVKKVDAKRFVDMLKRHTKELKEAMKDEEFAEAAFLYEMDNHEYCINWSGDEDVLDCFAITVEELKEMGLDGAYNKARNKHMKHAEEFGII